MSYHYTAILEGESVLYAEHFADEAEQIQQLMASDPDRLLEDEGIEPLFDALKIISEKSNLMLTGLSSDVLRRS